MAGLTIRNPAGLATAELKLHRLLRSGQGWKRKPFKWRSLHFLVTNFSCFSFEDVTLAEFLYLVLYLLACQLIVTVCKLGSIYPLLHV